MKAGSDVGLRTRCQLLYSFDWNFNKTQVLKFYPNSALLESVAECQQTWWSWLGAFWNCSLQIRHMLLLRVWIKTNNLFYNNTVYSLPTLRTTITHTHCSSCVRHLISWPCVGYSRSGLLLGPLPLYHVITGVSEVCICHGSECPDSLLRFDVV